ncbi:hypothetical protein [Methylobacterium terrae]|uniref:hypothetical protein n=1 Tax=Methylobacterium terrae TaxID=2202827 RepID=UPI003CCA27BE
MQQALEAEDAGNLPFRVGDVTTLHHGRFAAEDRRLLDTEIEAVFGKVDDDQAPRSVAAASAGRSSRSGRRRSR